MTTATAERIPMVLTGQALNSLRDSGYDLATALGEVVDNSLEANANNIHIRLDESENKRGKKHIGRIVIADDGEGMPGGFEETLHRYLQLGFSTRYMSKETIGKYGVGAKLAALNFGRRIDVWSRTDKEDEWLHVHFDLDEAFKQEKKGQAPGIELPSPEPTPEELADLFPEGTGTIVVWSSVDRLEEGRRAPDANELRVEVEKELSRIFRYFLTGGIRITVNGTKLSPHDPLMLMENSWSDRILTKHRKDKDKDGDPTDDAKRKSDQKHFPAELVWEEVVKVARQEAVIRITIYPREVVRKRGLGGDDLAKKLRVPENQGRISFVRLDREVSYTNVPRIFPRGVEDADRFFGIEVCFKPTLDDYFGIRNVKRGVEPHGDLRDKLRGILQKHLPTARKKRDDIWGSVAQEEADTHGEHAGVVNAATDAARTLPKGRAKGPDNEDEKKGIIEDLANDVVGTGEDKKQEREEYIEKLKGLPFAVESVNFPGTHFIDVQHVDNKVLIRLNTRHRFYREMWAPLRELATLDAGSVSGSEAVKAARRTIEALTLLVIAFGKAESMHENPHEQYGELRNYWGHFLDSLMGKVKDVI